MTAGAVVCFATYCSAAKDSRAELLPAIERYQSVRIRQVLAAATAIGVDFLILSGKFGLLRPTDPTPCYDHLLSPAEVAEHALEVAGQLRALGVGQLIFFTQPLARDPKLAPYLDGLRAACHGAGVELVLVELPPHLAS